MKQTHSSSSNSKVRTLQYTVVKCVHLACYIQHQKRLSGAVHWLQSATKDNAHLNIAAGQMLMRIVTNEGPKRPI